MWCLLGKRLRQDWTAWIRHYISQFNQLYSLHVQCFYRNKYSCWGTLMGVSSYNSQIFQKCFYLNTSRHTKLLSWVYIHQQVMHSMLGHPPHWHSWQFKSSCLPVRRRSQRWAAVSSCLPLASTSLLGLPRGRIDSGSWPLASGASSYSLNSIAWMIPTSSW